MERRGKLNTRAYPSASRASDIFIWIYVLCTTSNYAIIKARSAPHLELYMMPLFLERAVAVKRTRIRSAPQNAVLSHAAQGFQTQGNFKTTSPQGDGNHKENSFDVTDLIFQNHIPARGRKHHLHTAYRLWYTHISKPHPRKGTETPILRSNQHWRIAISKPHPRKGTETLKNTPFKNKNQNFKTTSPQGDGNKLEAFLIMIFSYNFKTTSPQGDGNTHFYGRNNKGIIISKPHPRKGTET